jgi:hypothetical protein
MREILRTKQSNLNRNYNVLQVNRKKQLRGLCRELEGPDDFDAVRALNLSTNVMSCQTGDNDSMIPATT